ncbi:unnamed protein product, partial [Staurois parvus]
MCPSVPPTCAHHSAHPCPAVHPPVPRSAPTCATLQCHLPVPRSATHLCHPPVPPTCAR